MGTSAIRIINTAARKIGVIGRGRELPRDEAMDWLQGLKEMLDQWSLESLMIPFLTRETYALTGDRSFTIGRGGDMDTDRPISIEIVQILDGAGNQYPLTEVSKERMENLFYAGEEGRPRFFHYDRAFPLSTLYLDLEPYDPTLLMWSKKPITAWQIEDLSAVGNPAFAGQELPTSGLSAETLTADIEFDTGYEAALAFNLAIHMAPEYTKEPSATVFGLAEQYKANIRRTNLEPMEMKIEQGFQPSNSYYDVISGPDV